MKGKPMFLLNGDQKTACGIQSILVIEEFCKRTLRTNNHMLAFFNGATFKKNIQEQVTQGH